MKRILCMILVLLMLTGTLLACQSSSDTPANTDDSTPAGDSGVKDSSETPTIGLQTGTDENGYPLDRLPEMDYKGKTVSILSWEDNKELTYPDEAGDGSNPIQYELYYHWRAIEKRMGIVFDPSYVKGYYGDRELFFTTARAEDAAYDLIQCQSLYPTTLAQEGRLSNLRNQTFPDLDRPWWSESVNEWTQYGALYYIVSNSSPNSISNINCMFVNIQMMQEEGLGDPVKLVLRNRWTIEEMKNYSKQFAGLAEANPGEIYHFVVDDWSRTDTLYYSAGYSSTRNNANGYAELAFDDAETLEALSNTLDQYIEIFKIPGATIYRGDVATDMYNQTTAMFLGYMDYIRKVEDPEVYAPIPAPKNDVQQENYRVIHRDCLDVWCVPISTQDKDLCGKIIEANASSEYRTIAPFYFEQYLKRRYASDAEGMKCFDLIRDSVVYDFGRIAKEAGFEGSWRNAFYNRTADKIDLNNNIMSAYTSSIESRRQELAKVLENYLEYKDL